MLQISTKSFTDGDRTEGFRETFGRTMLQLEIEPLTRGEPIDIDMAFRAFPTMGIADGDVSPVRCSHRVDLADNDDLIFTVVRNGVATWSQIGREANVLAGEAILTASGEKGWFIGHTQTQLLNFRFNRKKISARLCHATAGLIRPVPKDNPALRLLTSYASSLDEEQLSDVPGLVLAVDDHMHDLVALALGATRDAGEIADKRGARAVRLHVMKDDIISNIARRDLSVDFLAARHGISPRYIRSLFEDANTTFTDFVLSQRLANVHRRLLDPRHHTRPISAIAYEAGFGDLSYFNHAFRRHYGATPSDVRAAARHEN